MTKTQLTILLVDDDTSVIQLLKSFLTKKYDVNIEVALNGLEALLVLRDKKIDLIFLDIAMPEINGLEVLDAIRNDEEFKRIPVVIMSSISKKEIVQQALKFGIFDYIRKPIIIHEASIRFDQVIRTIQQKSSSSLKEEILVIDNDKKFIAELVKLLESRYSVLTAEDGAEGFKIFSSQQPKIIILGENIKILNEKYLSKKIKNHPSGKNTKIILTRTNNDLTDSEKQYIDLFVEKNYVSEIFDDKYQKPKNPFSSFKEFIEDGKNEIEKLEAYTKILGLISVDSFSDVTKAYREMMAKYHPDKVSHLGEEFQQFAIIKTKEINRAYDFFRKWFNV